MISAIFMDSNQKPLKTMKSLTDFFIAERAYDCSTGEMTLTLKNRKDTNALQNVRCILVFGEGLNNLLKVDKSTVNSTETFPKITYSLSGIENVLVQRNEQDVEIKWENVDPLIIPQELVERIQLGDEKRKISQLTTDATTEGSLEPVEMIQMTGGNVWEFIQALMAAHKFCVEAKTVTMGQARLCFRVPTVHNDILLTDMNKKVHLDYINTDYTTIVTSAIVGGEGEGIRRKYGQAETDETGIDRFEVYGDASSIDSGEGYVSNADYYKLLQEAANNLLVPKKLETDYKIPNNIFSKIKTGDTIFTSSSAVNGGKTEPRIVEELKTQIANGVTTRSITLTQKED